MSDYLLIPKDERQDIIDDIKKVLLKKEEVVFSFLHGSFLADPSFRDIDIAIYVKGIDEEKVFDYELKLSESLAEKTNLSFDIFDVKVLNFAPSPFLNNIFRNGKLLFSKDKEFLSDMIEKTSLEAISNEFIAYQSLRDLVPA
ncbi:nucleotidyltransferase domain-containing protein [Patescibacteria group bacterium]|nr:nucleotidyltransferase domain-containing protein [Patescibacteria group bacterium]MBU2633586.1 nucleotidyltransferase domain-containing protein [Patescibacteria group bacterium]